MFLRQPRSATAESIQTEARKPRARFPLPKYTVKPDDGNNGIREYTFRKPN